MGHRTNFELEQIVYYIGTEIVKGCVCPCCGVEGPKRPKPMVKRGKIIEIEISGSGVIYTLTGEKALSARYLYRTREEAEAKLTEIKEKEQANG